MASAIASTLREHGQQQDHGGVQGKGIRGHVYIAAGNPYSYLYDNGAFDGSILAGQTLRLGTFRIRVNSTGGPGGTASITIGPAGSP